MCAVKLNIMSIMAASKTKRYWFFVLLLLTAVFFYACDKEEDPVSDVDTELSEMLGLREVTVLNNRLVYDTISNVNEDSKILIMIHGWLGSPERWVDFVPKIMASSEVNYTNYWTYGYNSSFGIDMNGELFANAIQEASNGAHIDIVGHSMGGLVSRAALENHNAEDNVNSLTTLGTPHLGSLLAQNSHVINFLIATAPPFVSFPHNESMEGYNDMDPESSFIIQLANNPEPAIPYHLIACVNNPDKWWLSNSWMLPGPDDGIVTVESATTVSGATSPENLVFIDTGNAHVLMVGNDQVFDQVIDFLSSYQDL